MSKIFSLNRKLYKPFPVGKAERHINYTDLSDPKRKSVDDFLSKNNPGMLKVIKTSSHVKELLKAFTGAKVVIPHSKLRGLIKT